MNYTLANNKLTVFIDPKTGCIKQIEDSAIGSELKYLAPNACGNQLQAFADTPKQYDAWNIDPGTLDGTMTPIDKVDSIVDLNDGLRTTIRITRTWQKSHFVQDISLDANADFITIENDIDWHETHVLLKAAFPLAATAPKATYEIPYGSIERPTTRNNSWEKAKFEVPAMRWADLGDDKQGVSILNDSKYGYDAEGNTLRITLLRSPTWPDPDADRGHQHFTYALYPHTGTWKQAQTVRRGYELNDPLKAEQVFSHTGTLPAEHSWASVENSNVTLTAIKKAEDSDALVFRMYEWAGTASDVKLHIPPGATYAVETNLMEKPEGSHLSLNGDVVTVPIKPYEILTIEAFYPHNVAAK
jgi:alpha-mannosidase